MVFQLNHDDTFDMNIENGDYEVVIKQVGENVTQNGAEYIQVTMIIRNDVEQKHKNNHIFHKIWKAKATGEYNLKSFNIIGKAAQIPNKKVYKTMEELFDDFIGKPLKVRVKNETSTHNGQTYENLNVKMWNVTQIAGPVKHVYKEQAARAAVNDAFSLPADHELIISDDDLPF